MSGAVSEVTFQARTLENVARCSVDSCGRYSWPDGGDSGFLGFENCVIERAGFVTSRITHPSPRRCTRPDRRPSQEDGTCHVATVVAQYSTLVKDDQLVFPEELGCGARVGPGGARAGGDDGFKGWGAGTLQFH